MFLLYGKEKTKQNTKLTNLRVRHICIEESEEEFNFRYGSNDLDNSVVAWLHKQRWTHLHNSWHKFSQWHPWY